MQEFKDVTVVKKANVYFDGKVTSRTVLFPDGTRVFAFFSWMATWVVMISRLFSKKKNHGTKKTLGIMMPGDYEFGTAEREIMEILAGKLTIQLPGSPEWQKIQAGQSFEVPANSRFKLKITELTDYCCSYIK